MRFLIFTSQSSAQAAVDTIDANGRLLYQAKGYQIIDGEIVGKRLSDLTDEPSAQRTTTWDIPRQRLDGKWIVSHPENNPAGKEIINGSPASDLALAGVVYDSIETNPEDGTWFPLPKNPV